MKGVVASALTEASESFCSSINQSLVTALSHRFVLFFSKFFFILAIP
jgi:hypothetical protein